MFFGELSEIRVVETKNLLSITVSVPYNENITAPPEKGMCSLQQKFASNYTISVSRKDNYAFTPDLELPDLYNLDISKVGGERAINCIVTEAFNLIIIIKCFNR